MKQQQYTRDERGWVVTGIRWVTFTPCAVCFFRLCRLVVIVAHDRRNFRREVLLGNGGDDASPDKKGRDTIYGIAKGQLLDNIALFLGWLAWSNETIGFLLQNHRNCAMDCMCLVDHARHVQFSATKHGPQVVARLDLEQEALPFDINTQRP
jgi:hypothetical protein